MAVTAQQLAAELRAFDGRRVLVQALRRGIARAVPAVRRQVRDHALEILPSRGGLAAWVAAARVTVKIGYTSRSAGVKLRGSRRSTADKTDLAGIDAGRVRAPSWGYRTRAAWHSQAVTPGWWSEPLEAATDFRDHAEREVDQALEVIRRGA